MRSIWTTKNGYWKTTFEEEEVLGHNIIVGFKKIWRFFWGQEPNGEISDWIIKEYRLNPSLIPAEELNNRIIKKVSTFDFIFILGQITYYTIYVWSKFNSVL